MKAQILHMRFREIEKTFMHVPTDLHAILVFDGIDVLLDPPRYQIHSHDLHGPLPDIIIDYIEDRWEMMKKVQLETGKLIVAVRDRDFLAEVFPKCKFLLPTSTDNGSLVGIRFAGRTVLAEAPSHWEANHRLVRKAIERML
jgi:hypothetical protein